MVTKGTRHARHPKRPEPYHPASASGDCPPQNQPQVPKRLTLPSSLGQWGLSSTKPTPGAKEVGGCRLRGCSRQSTTWQIIAQLPMGWREFPDLHHLILRLNGTVTLTHLVFLWQEITFLFLIPANDDYFSF